jgi:hypothetical protein
MDRQLRNVLGVIVLSFAAAGVAWATTGQERNLAVFPAQNIPLRFDHALHLDAGADCTTCHESVTKSEVTQDLNLPGHEQCEMCHDIEAAQKGQKTDPPASCGTCHPSFDPTVRKEPAKLDMPSANLHFSHKLHLDKKVECVTCHGDMTKVNLATRQQLPKMATCFQCHDGSVAPNDCKTCHLKDVSGRLQLTFASGILRPMQGDPLGLDHGPRFEFTHGTRAAVSRQTCAQCHSDSFCQKCHDSLQKPLAVHPNDFITLHPLQARADASRCESCHRFQSFCAACHERAGVGMDSDPSLRPHNTKVHPDYQTWVEVLGPQHHGIAASKDIRSCTACHREESCMSCHSELSQRRQINPHPNGFASMCKRLAAANDRPCLKCHDESSLVQKGCR